jgi:hypothetical protein
VQSRAHPDVAEHAVGDDGAHQLGDVIGSYDETRRGPAWLRAALLSDAPPPWNRRHEYCDANT